MPVMINALLGKYVEEVGEVYGDHLKSVILYGSYARGGLNMSREGNFLVYCIERYKSAKGLTGIQVSELFSKYRVWDYIYSCFEALHTTGENYIIEDIDLYIKEKQAVV